jgi:nucleoside 2-deoxyribosyltransferase
MTNIRPFAFTLMPFDENFDDIYKFGIKKTCEDLGIVAERVDEQNFSETILERIYRQIENADFIIADMTGKNPNVFYEVGYAHAKGKLCALITQNSEDIPFDLKHHSHIIYNGKIKDLEEGIKPRLEWMKAEMARKKADIISVQADAIQPNLETNDYLHTGKFDLRVFLKNVSTKRSPEIDAIYITVTNNWRLRANDQICPSEKSTDKLQKFLIPISTSRLAPSAFAETIVTFERTLWTKFSGAASQEKYKSKGELLIEVVTSEGTLPFKCPLDVEFEEFPF